MNLEKLKLPEGFAKIGYACFANQESHSFVEWSTETGKATLYRHYNGRIDWDNLEKVKSWDSIDEAFREIETNKVLTCCEFFSMLGKDYDNPNCTNCFCAVTPDCPLLQS